MTETIRAFVSLQISPSPPLRDVLEELAALGSSVKSVAAENLHVTLKFLGNTDAGWMEGAGEALQAAVSQLPACDVVLRGLGAFPKPSRPSVIWTGMDPPEPMVQLADAVEQALVEFGFAPESRQFHPHVTLARIKSRPPAELAALLERHVETEFATVPVKEIALMQSTLSPQGSQYSSLSVARLD